MAAFHRASFAAGVATGVAVALVGRQLAVTAAEYYSEYVDDQDSDDEGEPYKMVLVVRNDLKSAPCQPATTVSACPPPASTALPIRAFAVCVRAYGCSGQGQDCRTVLPRRDRLRWDCAGGGATGDGAVGAEQCACQGCAQVRDGGGPPHDRAEGGVGGRGALRRLRRRAHTDCRRLTDRVRPRPSEGERARRDHRWAEALVTVRSEPISESAGDCS